MIAVKLSSPPGICRGWALAGCVYACCLLAGSSARAHHPLWESAPQVSSDGVWTDWIIDGQWRIQRHAIIGHYRLLDPHERRRAFGDMLQCYGQLQDYRAAGQVPEMPAEVVICLHGWRGNRASMLPLGQVLSDQGGYAVLNFGYASTQASIREQAVALESVLRNLRGVRRVNLVAHSMGNIVVRHLLHKFHVQDHPPPVTFGRMVMISPPNHGAELADTVGQRPLVQLLWGSVLDEFAPSGGWPLLEQQLATPGFEFAIVAGGRGDEVGFLPLLPGDDDGLLTLRTQQLEGATQFIQLRGMHQHLPQQADVQAACLQFLQQGHVSPPAATSP